MYSSSISVNESAVAIKTPLAYLKIHADSGKHCQKRGNRRKLHGMPFLSHRQVKTEKKQR